MVSAKDEQMTAPRAARQARIIFVNRYYFPDQSATSQLLADLAAGLVTRGLSVHIVCSRQRFDDAGADLPAIECVGGVSVHRVWTTRFGRDRLAGRAVDYASFYLTSLWTLVALLRKNDTVVAKTDPPLISVIALIAACLKRANLVNWLQDVFPEVASQLDINPLPRWLDRFLRRLRNASLRAAQNNIVLGTRMQEFLTGFGIPAEKITVIENWSEVDVAKPVPPAASRLRSRLGVAREFVVSYSGNLGRAHEFQTLLGAASLLQQQRDIVFLMIGGGAGMPSLKQAVLQQGLDNFRFLGYQPRSELHDSLAAADVHLVSLRPQLEGLIVPSKFYGVLAAGRPVIFIGDADGELARVIVPAKIGMVVEVGDAADLAACIEALKSDTARRSDMGARSYRLYEDRYSARRAFEEWVKILDDRAVSRLVKQPRSVDAALPPSGTPSNFRT